MPYQSKAARAGARWLGLRGLVQLFRAADGCSTRSAQAQIREALLDGALWPLRWENPPLVPTMVGSRSAWEEGAPPRRDVGWKTVRIDWRTGKVFDDFGLTQEGREAGAGEWRGLLLDLFACERFCENFGSLSAGAHGEPIFKDVEVAPGDLPVLATMPATASTGTLHAAAAGDGRHPSALGDWPNLEASAPPSGIRTTRARDAESACEAFIAGLTQRPQNKDAAFEAARGHCGEALSRKAFERAWARKAAAEWKRPGRRPHALQS